MSQAHLFPAQAQAVADLYRAVKQPNHISQNHLWLSGEMGVGKTYIASGFGNQINAKRVLIVSPATVTTKWQKVYQSFNPAVDIHIYQPRKDDETDLITTPQVNIVKHRDLVNFIKSQYNLLHGHQSVLEIENNLIDNNRKRTNDFINDGYLDFDYSTATHQILPKLDFDLIIFDEIHTIKPTTQEYAIMRYLIKNEPCPVLNLTGTIFNQNHEYLELMLWDVNPQIMQAVEYSNHRYYTDDTNSINDPAWFFTNIWQYIAVQVSLSDVNNLHKQDDIDQEIMPLNGIPLSSEQSAWISITHYQLNSLSKSKKYQDKLITNYLDFPSNKQPAIKSTHVLNNSYRFFRDNKTREITKSFASMQLTPTPLNETPKFKQVKSILKKYPQKTLIFVEDRHLIKQLTNLLPHAKLLPTSLAKSKYSQYINQALSDGTDNFIVTAKQISVGVDIDTADQIIWYQVPTDIATIIQAQRRIYRLTSTKSSRIFYLFYQDTNQEEIIKEVSQSAVHNAASYNVRQDDNLAKISEILFPTLKSDN